MLFRIVLAAAVLYFGVTGYAGWRVGSAISDARTHVLTRLATSVIGRHATERLALKKANLPTYITKSPAFWAALRFSE